VDWVRSGVEDGSRPCVESWILSCLGLGILLEEYSRVGRGCRAGLCEREAGGVNSGVECDGGVSSSFSVSVVDIDEYPSVDVEVLVDATPP
jgi:hypothetical protein